MVGAHCAISRRPISVEPVKVRARTIGLPVISAPISRAEPVITEKTPAGMPARCASSAMARAESGVSEAGLQTKAQPAASAGPALRVIIALGKFHGVMAATTPTGCLITTMRPLGEGRRNGFAIDAAGLFGEEFDEGGAIGNFAAGLGQRLALLRRHDLGQVFLVFHHQGEPFAQDGGALLGGLFGPILLGPFGCFDGLLVSARPI